MNFWALIKLIAGIISQLPFTQSADVSVMSDQEIEVLVRNEVEDMLGEPGSQSFLDIDFELLVAKIVAIVKLVRELIVMFQPKDPEAGI